MVKDTRFELRYYFKDVPHYKHYGSRLFSSFEEACDFAEDLSSDDFPNVESFEIYEYHMVFSQCVSSQYCPDKYKCKKCFYKRDGEKFPLYSKGE